MVPTLLRHWRCRATKIPGIGYRMRAISHLLPKLPDCPVAGRMLPLVKLIMLNRFWLIVLRAYLVAASRLINIRPCR
jgi:hypothetical protein